MTPDSLSAIIAAAQDTFGLEDSTEITLEANPSNVSERLLADWKSSGINRLSLGVQSLRDDALKFLGRDHSSDDALRSIELALQHIPSVSIDLIYARPGQKPESWRAELTEALALGVHHLSLYELTIEQRTAFGKAAARGDLHPMADDAQADLYELTDELTRASGYPAYEVSNHSTSTRHQSHHNMIYWQSGDWLGIGPGAHGRLTIGAQRLATEAARRPADYMAAKRPTEEHLSSLDTERETLAMGLRPVSGISLERLTNLDERALAECKSGGLIDITNGRLRTTRTGRLLTDAIAAKLSP